MKASKCNFVTMEELISMGKEKRPVLLEGFLNATGLSSWNAKAKTCKSTVLRQLAVAVAQGKPFLGRWQVKRPGRVLYYVMDDNRICFAKTMLALGLTKDDPFEARFGAVGMTRKEQLKLLSEVIEDRGDVVLVIFDTLVKFLQETEDGAYGTMTPAMQDLSELAEKHDIQICLAHHLKKKETDSKGDGMMGSVAVRAECELNVFFTIGKNGERIMSSESNWDDGLPETALAFDRATRTVSVGRPVQEVEEETAEDESLKDQGALYAIVLGSEGCLRDQILSDLTWSESKKESVYKQAIENEVIFRVLDKPSKKVSKTNPYRHYTKLSTEPVSVN